MELKNRIEKYKEFLTNTQLHIGENLSKIPVEKIKNMTLDQMSEEIFASKTSIFNFIQKIDFKNIFEFKSFLLSEKVYQSRLSVEINKTKQRLDLISFDSIIKDFNDVEKIIIVSKGFSKSLSKIIGRKIRKKGYSVIEINGKDGFDLINFNKKYFVIYITISGRFINKISSEFQNILEKYPNLLITHSKLPKQKINFFKYVLYGSIVEDYSREEFENPQNTLILCMYLIMYLENMIK